MRIKGFLIVFLLHQCLISMEKKPAFQRAISGFLNLMVSSKEPAALKTSHSGTLLADSGTAHSSSSDEEKEQLRISSMLAAFGIDPINHYESALNAILDRNKKTFVEEFNKITNDELKSKLELLWSYITQETPDHPKASKPKVFVPSLDLSSARLFNQACQMAAQEIAQEIYELKPSFNIRNKTHIPKLDLALLSAFQSSSDSRSSDSSSYSVPLSLPVTPMSQPVIHTIVPVPLIPSAAGPLKEANHGSILSRSRIKKEKNTSP